MIDTNYEIGEWSKVSNWFKENFSGYTPEIDLLLSGTFNHPIIDIAHFTKFAENDVGYSENDSVSLQERLQSKYSDDVIEQVKWFCGAIK